MRQKWYFASIIAVVSFPVVTLGILKVWSLVDSGFAAKSADLGVVEFAAFAALISFFVSSAEALFLSQDKKILSLIVAWLLMAVLIVIVTQVPPPHF